MSDICTIISLVVADASTSEFMPMPVNSLETGCCSHFCHCAVGIADTHPTTALRRLSRFGVIASGGRKDIFGSRVCDKRVRLYTVQLFIAYPGQQTDILTPHTRQHSITHANRHTLRHLSFTTLSYKHTHPSPHPHTLSLRAHSTVPPLLPLVEVKVARGGRVWLAPRRGPLHLRNEDAARDANVRHPRDSVACHRLHSR